MKVSCGGRVIGNNIKMCDSAFSKFKGLMFSKKLKQGEGLVLKALQESILGTSIHMWFVFFGIDVIWVNDNMKVVDVRENVKPFSFMIKPRKSAKYVIELGVGGARGVVVGEGVCFS